MDALLLHPVCWQVIRTNSADGSVSRIRWKEDKSRQTVDSFELEPRLGVQSRHFWNPLSRLVFWLELLLDKLTQQLKLLLPGTGFTPDQTNFPEAAFVHCGGLDPGTL